MLQSCQINNIINNSNKENLILKPGFHKFIYEDNQIIIKTEFTDNIERNFLLDLGAPINTIFMDSSMKKIIENSKPIQSLGRSSSADGISIKREYLPWGNLKTNLFELENSFVSSMIRPDPFACSKLSGMWGSEIFASGYKSKKNKILLILMQDSTVAVLDSLPSLENWTKIITSFTVFSHIHVKYKIGEKKAKFIFDTGFGGSIIMNRETYLTAQREPNSFIDQNQIYGYITNTLTGTQMDTAYRGSFIMDLGNGIISDSTVVISTSAVNVNAIGMEFIKRFNVLVDYKKNALYLQPNPNYQHPKKTFFMYKGFKARNMNDNNILVINLEVDGQAEKAGLKVGDQILSINNIKANEGDNCEVVKLISEIDGNSTQNEVTVKRGNEIMKFTL